MRFDATMAWQLNWVRLPNPIMKNLFKSLVLAAALAAPFGASAAVQQGLMEVDFSASYSSLDVYNADVDLGLFSGSFGYFVTDALEVNAGLTYLHADVEGVDIDAVLASGGVDYHFNTQSDFVPFVGGALYFGYADFAGNDGDDWGWEVRAGLKQFIRENIAIRYTVSYMNFDELELDGISVGVGLAIFL